MKKSVLFLLLIGFVALINGCDYDDSNDIDFLNPIDSTTTGIITPEDSK